MEHFDYKEQYIEIKVKFDSHEFACFHDYVIDVTDKHLSQKELIEVWDMLPNDIKLTALRWGMSDTEYCH